jgi:hypothetical protein
MELVGVDRDYQETADAPTLSEFSLFQVWMGGELTDPQLFLGNRLRLGG